MFWVPDRAPLDRSTTLNEPSVATSTRSHSFSRTPSAGEETPGRSTRRAGATPNAAQLTRTGVPPTSTTASRTHGTALQTIEADPSPASSPARRRASASPLSRTRANRGAMSSSWTASIEQPQIESCGWFCSRVRQRSRISSRARPPVSASSGSHRSRRRRSQAAFSCLIQTRVEFTARRIGRYLPRTISPASVPLGSAIASAYSSRLAMRASTLGAASRSAATAPGRRLPAELRPETLALVANTAGEHVRAISEAAQYLRRLRRMAERVGDVSHAHGTAERRRDAETFLEVAHERFARDEQVVGEDVPRTDEESFRADKFLDARSIFRPLLEVIFDRDHVSVEGEGPELGVALEKVEELRDHRNETRAIALEPFVPFAVPMRMRDDVGAPARAPAQPCDDERRAQTGDDADERPGQHVAGVVHTKRDALE